MNKFFSFTAGIMSGVVVGGVAALLMAPASGNALRTEAQSRWEEALAEARRAMQETRRQKELEFEMMKESGEIR
ncbi:MAG: YtxH domain-containing protein [Candidatus Promineifilaceae bacterium]|nr:YtxH domain-containing protein [Candidatus Promineifilaceae bacterium]